MIYAYSEFVSSCLDFDFELLVGSAWFSIVLLIIGIECRSEIYNVPVSISLVRTPQFAARCDHSAVPHRWMMHCDIRNIFRYLRNTIRRWIKVPANKF